MSSPKFPLLGLYANYKPTRSTNLVETTFDCTLDVRPGVSYSNVVTVYILPCKAHGIQDLRWGASLQLA